MAEETKSMRQTARTVLEEAMAGGIAGNNPAYVSAHAAALQALALDDLITLIEQEKDAEETERQKALELAKRGCV